MKTIILAMLFATAMFADSVTLTGVNGASDNGFDVSPYYLSIDGADPIAAWCIDYLDHVAIGETWGATVSVNFGTYFPAIDYAGMFGIIQAELNDPSPDLAGYQKALWGIEDPTDFAPPAGIYLADEGTPLLVSFQIIDGSNPSDPNRPQAFIVDSVAPEPRTWVLIGVCWFVVSILWGIGFGKFAKAGRGPK